MTSAYLGSSPRVGNVTAGADLLSGTDDPSVAGVPAELSSLYFKLDTGDVYRKDGALDTDWVLLGSGTATPANDLWAPRTNPHPADDEFEGPALAAAWSQTGFTALDFGNRPSPYVNPVTNRASFEKLGDPDNSADTSWLRIQPGAGIAGVWKRLDTAAFGGATPANLLAWARVRFSARNGIATAASDGDVGISFFEDTGAGFSFALHATMNLCNTQEGTAAAIKALFWGRNGGAITSVTETQRLNDAATFRMTAQWTGYIALQKIGGNLYDGWLINDGGRVWMGRYNDAALAAVNAVAIWTRDAGGGGGGALIQEFDFIRFYQGQDWIP